VQNKEFDVLKGLICYNERMNKYERQIEDILQLRNILVSNKDKKIEELDTKLKELMVRNASINKTLKAENKKNQEKLSKYIKENTTLSSRDEIESLLASNNELTEKCFKYIENETVVYDNSRLLKENADLK